eukprot:5254351-Pyramimonas_sp.AAC.2
MQNKSVKTGRRAAARGDVAPAPGSRTQQRDGRTGGEQQSRRRGERGRGRAGGLTQALAG